MAATPPLPPSNHSLRPAAEAYRDAGEQTAMEGASWVNDEPAIVRDAMDIADLYFDLNTEVWAADVRYWGLYLGDHEDPRLEEEKTWRANIHVPKPFRAIEAKVAVHSDLMTSASPMIQVEGVSEEDEAGRAIERRFDYYMRKNRWRGRLPKMLRAIDIQGGTLLKVHWTEQSHAFQYEPTQGDYDDFRKACMDAIVAGAPSPMPDPVSDPKGWKVWQTYVNQAGRVRVPDPPFAGTKVVRKYCGPKLTPLSKFDVWIDPAVDEMVEQQAVFHRSVKSARWVLANAGPEPWQMYDPAAVARALKKDAINEEYGQRFSKHQEAINDILGVSANARRDPLWEDAQEIYECYFAGEPLGEYPFVVILNGVIINKNPRQMPFMHGEVPILYPRNLALPGMAHGVSDFQQLESIFWEIDHHRNLRADGTTLALIPSIKKLASLAMPELQRTIRPGMVLPVSRLDAVDQLFKITMPEAAYREPQEMERDVDETMSVGPNVSGQTATIGRIPATTEQGRLQQALARLKLSLVQIEEDLEALPRQMFALEYEKGDSAQRESIAGRAADPYRALSKSEALEAVDKDYRMTGATAAIDKNTLAKNLSEFGLAWGEQLTPIEIRTVMGEVLDVIGTKNAKKIVSEEGTADATVVYNFKKEMAMAQMKVQAQQAAMGQMQTPNAVGEGEMAAMEAEGGGAEVPPEGQQGGGM